MHLATRGRVPNHVMSLCLRPSQASHCPQDQANPCAGVQCLPAPSQTTLRLLPCTPGHPPSFSTPRSLRFVLLHGFRVVLTGREVLPASWHLPRRRFPVQPDSVESSVTSCGPGPLFWSICCGSSLCQCSCLSFFLRQTPRPLRQDMASQLRSYRGHSISNCRMMT